MGTCNVLARGAHIVRIGSLIQIQGARMRAQSITESRGQIERLEPRRLLSFTPFGNDILPPGMASATAVDVAAADNGAFIVAAAVSTGATTKITAVRYSSTGEQLGQPINLASFTSPVFAS